MSIPNPARVITTTVGGMTFRAGRRTAAHLAYTVVRLAKEYPKARLRVIQPCYHTGVAASAGTHDKDGVLDVWIDGLSGPEAQKFLRRCGWAAWYRYPPTFPTHIHMVSLGCPGPVGVFVPGQISDYYAHRTGLVGHVHDATWHPRHIDATVFDYRAWLDRPAVSLKRAKKAARTPAWRLVLATKTKEDRHVIRRALKEEGLDTYRQWQLRLGYRGDDANGIPGRTSLKALGDRHGFRVVS